MCSVKPLLFGYMMRAWSKFNENFCSSSKPVRFPLRLTFHPHPLLWLFDPLCLASTRLISVKSPSAEEEEDIDVARERQRVHDGRAHNDLLRVCDLTKVELFSFVVVQIKVCTRSTINRIQLSFPYCGFYISQKSNTVLARRHFEGSRVYLR